MKRKRRTCMCGCGEVPKLGNTFINYHNRKGMTHSCPEETKIKMREMMLGRIFTKEHKRNIAKSATGRVFSGETKRKISEAHKGMSPWNKGIPHSEETKKKLSEANKGHNPSEETRKKLSIAGKGRLHTPEARAKISMTKIERYGKNNSEYCDAWADQEFKKDMRKPHCEECGITNHLSFHIYGVALNLHHFDGNKANCFPSNLQTLCKRCHSQTTCTWRMTA